jgi:hypothetical protein
MVDLPMEKIGSEMGRLAWEMVKAIPMAIWTDPVLFWSVVLLLLLTLWACWRSVSIWRLEVARRRRYESEFADLADTERMIKVSQAMDAARKLGSWYP